MIKDDKRNLNIYDIQQNSGSSRINILDNKSSNIDIEVSNNIKNLELSNIKNNSSTILNLKFY